MAPNWLTALFGPNVSAIDIYAFNPLALVILLVPLFFLRERGKSVGYLLCFSLFFLYMWAILAYTIFPLPVRSHDIEAIRYFRWTSSINLVPGVFSDEFDIRSVQVYGNFLLGVPFGFGLPFVVASTPKRVLRLGLGLAAGLELAQFGIGLLVYQGPYRSIDIDDVVLVFTGTLFGYGVLWAVAHVYRRLGWAGGARLPVWAHIHVVLLFVASASR